MHSSRMRTGRSLTVCWSLLPGGGVCSWGGVWSGGLLRGGGGGLLPGERVCVCSGGGGVWPGGGSEIFPKTA